MATNTFVTDKDGATADASDDADTIAKLKAAWDTSTLGDSPYA
jgi:hypothetical protein